VHFATDLILNELVLLVGGRKWHLICNSNSCQKLGQQRNSRKIVRWQKIWKY